EPDQALRDVTLIHDICKILQKPPSHQPMTLVEAMIDVAIMGLYANTLADGMRLHAWQEPQLAVLEKQLEDVNLGRWVQMAFEAERANVCFRFENMSQKQLAEERLAYKKVGSTTVPRWKDLEYLFFTFAPRGWVYQNMVFHANFLQTIIHSYDPTNNLITVRNDPLNWEVYQRSPYVFLNTLAIPNFIKATQTTAHNQAQIDE